VATAVVTRDGSQVLCFQKSLGKLLHRAADIPRSRFRAKRGWVAVPFSIHSDAADAVVTTLSASCTPVSVKRPRVS
jgi:hypothetical protein